MSEMMASRLVGIMCDRCQAVQRFPSEISGTYLPEDHAMTRSLQRLGWSMWVGARSRRAYCPDCSPTVPMRRLW